MPDTVEQLNQLTKRVTVLSKTREQIIKDVAVAENNLKASQDKLREWGIETDGLSSKELQTLAEVKDAELQAKLAELTAAVEQGEALVDKYNQLKGG